MKGRSTTLRHVSRNHSVALDRLFDRIHLGSKILIRYIDTEHQLADILTKGNVTRDEWNNLLHLFNISHFSSICCAENSSFISCPKTMAKRMQAQKGEERSVAKSKSTALNLSSHVPTSSSSAKKSDCVPKVRGDIHSYGETRKQGGKKFEIRRSVEFSKEAERCIPWRVGGQSHGEKNNQGMWTFPNLILGVREEAVKERPIAYQTAEGKTNAPSKSDHSGNPKAERKERPHNLHVSPATAVFSIVRTIYGREHDDHVDDLDVNLAIWGTFLNTTFQAAVHLG